MKIKDYKVILFQDYDSNWKRHISALKKIPLCKKNTFGFSPASECSLIYYSKHKMSTYNLLCKKCCTKLPKKVHNELKHYLIIVKLKS